MAISTTKSHIADAIQLQAKYESAYLVIGKSTAWTDEENPPEEVADVETVQEVIGYKKVKNFSLARPLATGEDEETVGFPVVSYRDQKWALVPVSKAYEEKARWVYIEAEIQPDEFPNGEYRQVGIHVDLVPKNGLTKQNLLPSEVTDVGTLRFYENRKAYNLTSNLYSLEQFIVVL
ncbi:virion structural protein [Bacillus phage Bobb]|uniref:Baseplate protein n=1 Tax=Bacillus phage Bobb TaxID=1527469 RepID=A0A076G6Z8_9CAUD|nr:virion structural protein [Bacillus phage Bobb]AII28067.1 hypothetical protein [Bacillus phage Bobb]